MDQKKSLSEQPDSLSTLRQKIDHADRAREMASDGKRNNARLPAEMMAMVGRIATEMVAGVAVGGFLGWLLDNWLGTSPLLMIIMVFFGAGAGMMNIWRMATGHGLKIGYFDHQGDNQTTDGQEKDRTRD